MKKHHQIIVLSKLFFAFALCFNLSSCIDCCDDEATLTPNLNLNDPVFEPGIHPVQIGTMIFEYNPDYSIATFGDGPYAKATYHPFEIYHGDEYEDEKDITKITDFRFNESGKITYFNCEMSYYYNSINGYEYIGTENVYLDYNSEGRLTHFSGDVVYKDYDYETEKYSTENLTFTADCQWSAGNLHKIVIKVNSDGNMQYTSTYTFEYGNQKNELQQYVSTIWEWELSESFFDNDDIGGLINLKLFGNPSEYFVTKVTHNSIGYDEEGSWNDTYTSNYTYTFNDDKTIKSYTEIESEIYDGEEYNYTNTWDCVFTDDYSVTPDIQGESRATVQKKKNPRKSTLFRIKKH